MPQVLPPEHHDQRVVSEITLEFTSVGKDANVALIDSLVFSFKIASLPIP